MARTDGIHGPKRARYGDGTVVSIGDIIGDPTQVQPRGPHEVDDRPRVSRINHGAGVVFLRRVVLDGSRVVPEDLGWFFADKLQVVPDNVSACALGLRDLRRLDRYGMADTGQQYRGFAALPSAEASTDVAATVIAEAAHIPLGDGSPDQGVDVVDLHPHRRPGR